jgi:hypothetical protein
MNKAFYFEFQTPFETQSQSMSVCFGLVKMTQKQINQTETHGQHSFCGLVRASCSHLWREDRSGLCQVSLPLWDNMQRNCGNDFIRSAFASLTYGSLKEMDAGDSEGI